MKFNLQGRLSAIGLALVAAAGTAGAQTTTLVDIGPTYGTTTNYNVAGTTGAYAPSRTMNTGVGTSSFNAFCIDPLTYGVGSSTYTITTLDTFLNGTTTSGYAQQIGAAVAGGRGISGYSTLSTGAAAQLQVLSDLKELFSWAYTDSQANATKAAAFGMAVWEIIMQDGGVGTTSTALATTTYAKASGRAITYGSTAAVDSDAVEVQTNTYLTALNNNTWNTAGVLGTSATQSLWNYTVYYDAASPYSQNFLTVSTGGSGVGVPEPGTASLVALALFGALRVSRRKTSR